MCRIPKLAASMIVGGLLTAGLVAHGLPAAPTAHANPSPSTVEVTLVDANFDSDPVGSLPAPFQLNSAGCPSQVAITDEASASGTHSLKSVPCELGTGWKVTVPSYAPIVGIRWSAQRRTHGGGFARSWLGLREDGAAASLLTWLTNGTVSIAEPTSSLFANDWVGLGGFPNDQFVKYDVILDYPNQSQVVRMDGAEVYNGPSIGGATATFTGYTWGLGTTYDDDIKLTVTYDGGLATGGGWINSPAGAYPANPGLTGKANFGFDARYKDGKTVPEGQVEFQLKAANLNFKANGPYEWLSVSETERKAWFRTSGTINGAGNYGVLGNVIASATSGSPDLIRIKIWDKANGNAVVYDSQLGTACPGDYDYYDPCTPVVGGDVKIHK